MAERSRAVVYYEYPKVHDLCEIETFAKPKKHVIASKLTVVASRELNSE